MSIPCHTPYPCTDRIGLPHTLLTTPFPFYLSPSADAWFTMEKSSIITHYIAARGWGGEFTPHIITSGNPHDPGLGPEAKSPRGEITHHLATLLSPWYAPCCLKFLLQTIQPVGECMQDMKFSLKYSATNEKFILIF